MPMIDFTYLRGSLDNDTRTDLVRRLSDIALRWEGAPIGNARAQSLSWVFVDEKPVTAVFRGGRSPEPPVYRVVVHVPAGTLSPRRRAGLIEELTAAVVDADGRSDSDVGQRVWVLVHELAPGSWGSEGRAWDRDDVVAFVSEAL